MQKRVIKILKSPALILSVLIFGIYYQFFLQGKIPLPADAMVGTYYPWFGYKWDYIVGVPVKNPLLSDAYSQFFMWKYLAVDLIKSGNWPLWNNYSFSGTPFLATYHSATLLPFNLLLLLPKYFGWGIYIFGQTLVAALGMYYLCGSYTKNPAARICAGIVFSLSGLMMTWVEFGTGVWAAAMLPWTIGSLEYYFNLKQRKYLFLITISFVFLYLSGHAQLTVYSTILFFIHLTYKAKTSKSFKIANLFEPVFFWLLSVGIVMVQVLPTLDLFKYSIRSHEEFAKNINYGLNKPYELIRLYVADFFGNPVTGNHWDNIYYAEQSSFLGTLTLPLIFPLLFKKFRSAVSNYWFVIFGVCLILAIESPLTLWFYSQPLPLLTYSSASRIFFILSFAAGILVSLGITKFQEDKQFAKWTGRTGLILLAILSGILTGFLAVILTVKDYSYTSSDLVQMVANFKVSLKNSAVPVLILLFLYITSLFSRKKLVIWVVVFVAFFDLGRYFWKHTPFVPSNIVFPETPITQYLENQKGLFRVARADHDIFPPNTWLAYRLQSVEGYDPLSLESYGRYFNKVNGSPFSSSVGRFDELSNYPTPYLDALNVKYFMAVKRDENGVIPGDYLSYKLRSLEYKVLIDDRNSVILENPNALERAYFVDNIQRVTNDADELKFLNTQFDPLKSVIVNTFDELSKPDPEANKSGVIKITGYFPNKVLLSTETESNSFVVLADSYDKNWHLKMNSLDVKLYKVNGALRGFEVPAGKNNFEMFYYPQSFKIGLKLSMMSLSVFGLAALYGLFKKKGIN